MRYKRLLNLLFSMLLLCCMSITVCASNVPDISQKGSISITMRYNGAVVSGGTLTMYKVGTLYENNGEYSFMLMSEFTDSGVSLDNIESAEAAETLASYAVNRGIAGITESIGSSGTVSFSDLELGIYLFVQNKAASGYNIIAPFVVNVPMSINNEYEYNIDASPKLELRIRSGGGSSSRSSKSKTTSTAQPNKSTSTSVSATSTPKPENTPSGRTSSGSPNTPQETDRTPSSGSPEQPKPTDSPNTTSVPNSFDELTPNEKITTSKDSNPPTSPDTPTGADEPDNPSSGDKPKLPQTGQLNWPIPLLAVLGLALFSIGWILCFGGRKHNR